MLTSYFTQREAGTHTLTVCLTAGVIPIHQGNYLVPLYPHYLDPPPDFQLLLDYQAILVVFPTSAFFHVRGINQSVSQMNNSCHQLTVDSLSAAHIGCVCVSIRLTPW